MKFLFVIDPLENLNLKTDSSIEMMKESLSQGIDVFYVTDSEIFFENDAVYANASQITSLSQTSYQKTTSQVIKLDQFKTIFMRKEPPYDLTYHYTTMLLEKAKSNVLNNPQGLRNANEKLVILNFPDLIPHTIVSKDEKRILDFLAKHKRAVIKPIDLYGGKNVLLLDSAENKKQTLKKIASICNAGKEYAIVQEFIEKVYQGDKRVFLLNGKPLGAIARVPQDGEFRANMGLGGIAQKTTLSSHDKKIIAGVAPYLQEQGLVLAGVDIIDGKLIEINVTCPTGLVQIREFAQKNTTKSIIDFAKK